MCRITQKTTGTAYTSPELGPLFNARLNLLPIPLQLSLSFPGMVPNRGATT